MFCKVQFVLNGMKIETTGKLLYHKMKKMLQGVLYCIIPPRSPITAYPVVFFISYLLICKITPGTINDCHQDIPELQFSSNFLYAVYPFQKKSHMR